jgi:hypothetical protein
MSGLDMREEVRGAFGLETVMSEVLGRSFGAEFLGGSMGRAGEGGGNGFGDWLGHGG